MRLDLIVEGVPATTPHLLKDSRDLHTIAALYTLRDPKQLTPNGVC
jgi:hypothetical protein